MSETRFVNVVSSPEIDVEERKTIQLLWATPALLSWIDKQSSELNLEFIQLRDKLMLSEKMWQNLEFYIKLQGPLRLFLQKSDGEDFNFHLFAYEYYKSKADSLALVKEGYQNEQ